MEENIVVKKARTHNLKGVDVSIPHNKLTVITGLSGSGKSSLAFDTIYAEGQRRYVESLNPYARQFLELMEKPDVESIEGLSPSIAIEQKNSSASPRSTVGTMTEIHDILRLLFARTGTPHCPVHGHPLRASSPSQIIEEIVSGYPVGSKLMIIAPAGQVEEESFDDKIRDLQSRGYTRFAMHGTVFTDPREVLPGARKGKLDVVIDRIKVKVDSRPRIAESVEDALLLGGGVISVVDMDTKESLSFSEKYACPDCGFTMDLLEPALFSFNSPQGACEACGGLGELEQFDRAKLVVRPDLSLRKGAVWGWGEGDPYSFALIRGLARELGFSVDTPWNKLPEEARAAVFEGTDKPIEIEYAKENGGKEVARQPFEGILAVMERRWESAGSKKAKPQLEQFRSLLACPVCQGRRLSANALLVTVGEGEFERNISEISRMQISDCLDYFKSVQFETRLAPIAEKLAGMISLQLECLVGLGLGYLTLERAASTLSGGEAQRIRLASQISSRLTGVTYVLDEPSIGLHQHDNDKLLKALTRLRDLGNTVIVVEHDEETMEDADYIVDMGPGAGGLGGEVCAAGTVDEIKNNPASLTGKYLSGRKTVRVLPHRKPSGEFLRVTGARGNNLKNVKVEIPVGLMTVVTGVSGSGKSTLVNETIYAEAARRLNGASSTPLAFESISGLEFFDKVIHVDQKPIGRTPKSNPATYTGLMTPIRELFAEVPLSRERGYSASRFSFNAKGGRCEACEGEGLIKVEMNFLPDMYVPCEVCHGTRYNRETLDVLYRGYNISQVLNLTVDEALPVFKSFPPIVRKLKTLQDVGLGYIKLGQSATTLSGGEAQRIKLAQELSKKDTGRTLYILDEPTTGLHFQDVDILLGVLERLRDAGNTILLIEHNLDVIRAADWLIDMGPEGGYKGGTVVAEGTVDDVRKNPASKTALYLQDNAGEYVE